MEQLEARQMLTGNTYVVSTLTDVSVAGSTSDDQWSLREALAAATSSGAAKDTIKFAATLEGGTISLALGQLNVTSDVDIVGLGADKLTIDAHGASRTLSVNDSNAGTLANVTISGVTLAGGYATDDGGNVRSIENLTLDSVVLTGGNANTGGGVYHVGSGSLTFANSSITENSAYWAGGVRVDTTGSVLISASAFYENNAIKRFNSGVWVTGSGTGAGLYLSGGTTTVPIQIVNSTISDNDAEYGVGGVAVVNGHVVMTNDTVAYNNATSAPGGIWFASGGLALHNSIVAKNTVNGTTNSDLLGTVNAASSYNIFGAGANSQSFTGAGNQLGSPTTPIDPKLAHLDDYGGPTRIYALLNYSPALDAGSDTLAGANDQRGNARPFNVQDVGISGSGHLSDIGAYEADDSNVLTVRVLEDRLESSATTASLSLREALTKASSLAGGETINFDSTLFIDGPATIALAYDSSTDTDTTPDTLKIDSGYYWQHVTIRGPGADKLIVDGGGHATVFTIGYVTLAEISGLTITGGSGDKGGGIYASQSDLTVRAARITGNTAANAGGGIYNYYGDTRVVDSEISANSVTGANGVGGGIAFRGWYEKNDVEILNSTISGNAATGANSRGGGVYLSLYYANFGGTRTKIVNSTITGNSAASGGGLDSSVTFDDGAFITAHNSIIAANLNVTTATSSDVSGTNLQNSSSYNLIGSGGSGGLANNQNGNEVLTSEQDPGLGQLAFNGGKTRTHALSPSSLAVNAGSNSAANAAGIANDQRSRNRFVDRSGTSSGVIDIGAYEYGLVVSTLEDDSDGNYTEGDLSLREALALAAALPGLDEIEFDELLTDGVINLSLGELNVNSDVEILGPGLDQLEINAQGASRVFIVQPGVEATIEGLTLSGGGNVTEGGGVFNYGDLTLQEVAVVNNQTLFTGASAGGGIASRNYYNGFAAAALKLIDSTVDGNRARYGGGLKVHAQDGSSLEIIRSTVSHNTAFDDADSGLGGGLWVWVDADGTASIVNSTFSANSALIGGGLMVYGDGQLTLVNDTITDNHADISGGFAGGLDNAAQTTITLHNTILAKNTAANASFPDIYGSVGGTTANPSSHNILGVQHTAWTLGQTPHSGLVDGVDGNQVGNEGDGLDPMLSQLGNFGGSTLTHIPFLDSPALDRVPLTNELLVDQRGFPRYFDREGQGNELTNYGDVGTSESNTTVEVITVTTLDDELDVVANHIFALDDLSLREAFDLARAGGVEIIKFHTDLSGGTLKLELGQLVFPDDGMELIGPGPDKLTIDAQHNSRVFYTGGDDPTLISGLTITGGNAIAGAGLGQGGGIFGQALILDNVRIIGNTATHGGGVYDWGNEWPLSIRNSVVEGNTATLEGGGVWYRGEAGGVYNSAIVNNSATTGGGVYFEGTAGISNSVVARNHAVEGAGVYLTNTHGVGVCNSTIVENVNIGNYLGAGISVHDNAEYGSFAFPAVHNSIISLNSSSNGTVLSDVSGDFDEVSSHNLIGVLDENQTGLDNDPTTLDLTGQNPRLLPLGNYGGRVVSYALMPDSPAIDSGDASLNYNGIPAGDGPIGRHNEDQRGFVGVVNFTGTTLAHVDIGAFELERRITAIEDEADFNGDGRNDEAFFDPKTGNLNVLLDLGDRTELSSWSNLTPLTAPDLPNGIVGVQWDQFYAGDFNGDGRDDLLVRNGYNVTWTIAASDGTTFNIAPLTDPLNTVPDHFIKRNLVNVQVGDFDGDGKDELVGRLFKSNTTLLNPNANEWEVIQFDEMPSAKLVPSLGSTLVGFGMTYYAGDVNRDDRDDLIGKVSGSDWQVSLSQTDGKFSTDIDFDNWFDDYIVDGVLDVDGPLNTLIDAFASVYNNIELEFYPGLMKGPTATLQTKRGNDWDQAALLVSLLPTQFQPTIASATLTVPLEDAMAWVGASNTSVVDDIIKAAFDPSATLVSNGTAIQYKHAFVQVSIPTATGLAIVAIDPSWKNEDFHTGITPWGFDENAYIASSADYFRAGIGSEFLARRLPLEFYEDELSKYLADNASGTSLAEQQRRGTIVQKVFQNLPLMAYPTTGDASHETIDQIVDSASETLTHRIRISLKSGPSENSNWSWVGKLPDIGLKSILVENRGSAGSYSSRLLIDGAQVDTDAVSGVMHLYVEVFAPGESIGSAFSASVKDYTIDLSKHANETLAVAIGASQFDTPVLSARAHEALVVNSDADSTPDDDGLPDLDDVRDVLAYASAKYWYDVDTSADAIAAYTHTWRTHGVHAAILSASGSLLSTSVVKETPFGLFTDKLQIDAFLTLDGQDGTVTHAGTFIDVAQGFVNREAIELYVFQYSALEHTIIGEIGGTEPASAAKVLQMAYSGVPQVFWDSHNPNPNSRNYVEVLTFAVRSDNTVELRHDTNLHAGGTQTSSAWGNIWTSTTQFGSNWSYDNLGTTERGQLVNLIDAFLANDVKGGNLSDTRYPVGLSYPMAIEIAKQVSFVSDGSASKIFVPRSRVRIGDTGQSDTDWWQGAAYFVIHGSGKFATKVYSAPGNAIDGGSSTGIDLAAVSLTPQGRFDYLASTNHGVSTANGNEFRQETDIVYPNIGIPLTFGRTYNSQSTLRIGTVEIEPDVGFGTGWTHSFSDRLFYDSASGTIDSPNLIWLTSSGEQHRFAYQSNTYTTPPELIGTFTSPSHDLFKYLDHDGTEYWFERANQPNVPRVAGQSFARLIKKLDFNHEGVIVSYYGAADATDNSAYRVANVNQFEEYKIQNAINSNRYLHFDYESSGHISTVSKFAVVPESNEATSNVGTWLYGYDTISGLSNGSDSGKRLSSVASATDSQTTEGPVVSEYDYYGSADPSFKRGLLKRATAPNADFQDYEYYFNKRVFRVTTSANSELTDGPASVAQTYAYELFAHKTQVWDQRGNVETYVHQANGLTLRQIHPDRSRIAMTWDPSSAVDGLDYLITSHTDEVGAVRTYAYYDDTSATKVRELRETTAPHFVNSSGQVIDPDKLLVTLLDYYNPPQRPHIRRTSSITVDPVTTLNPDGQNLVTTFSYIDDPNDPNDAIGRLGYVIDPLLQVAASFSYYDNGLPNLIYAGNAFDAPAAVANYIVYRTLGEVNSESGTVTVQLPATGASGFVLADAVRLDRIGDVGSTSVQPTGTFVLDDQDDEFTITDTGISEITHADSTSGLVGGKARKLLPSGGGTATWKFTNLPPGRYRVAVSIPEVTGAATTANFKVYDGAVGPSNLKLDAVSNQDDEVGPGRSATNWTQFVYDAAGNISARYVDDILYAGSVQYDHSGRPTLATDRSGVSSASVHDVLGRLRSFELTDPDGSGPLGALTTVFGYDASGQALTTKDPLGRVEQVAYDLRGNVIKRTGADGAETKFSYDEAGNLVAQTDELKRTTRFKYDSRNRLVQKIYADGSSERIHYDGVGRVSSTVDENGHVATFKYDAVGRLLSAENAEGNTAFNQYDDLGRVERTIDYRGVHTVFEYDKLGRVTETRVLDQTTPTEAPRFLSTIDYDRNGNVVRTTVYDVPKLVAANEPIPDDPRPLIESHPDFVHVVRVRYDALNRAVETIIDDGKAVGSGNVATRTLHDGDGRVRFTVDELGRYNEFKYDEYGRLEQMIEPDADGVGADNPVTLWQYDAVGNVIASEDANGHAMTGLYDARNRLIQSTDAEGNSTRFSYDAAGQLIATIDALGRAAYLAYDKRGRKTLDRMPDPDGSGLLTAPATRFEYDKAGNLSAMVAPNGFRTGFEYDELNRLVKELTTDVQIYDEDAITQVTGTPTPAPNVEASYGRDHTTLAGNGSSAPSAKWVVSGQKAGQYRVAITWDGAANLDIAATVQVKIFNSNDELVQSGDVKPANQSADPRDFALDYQGQPRGWLNLGENFDVPEDGWIEVKLQGGGSSANTVIRADAVMIDRVVKRVYDYDNNGNLESQTDALDRITVHQYDELGRVTKTTSPDPDQATSGPLASPVIDVVYDGYGNVKSIIERRGSAADRTTEFVYDKRNRQVRVIQNHHDGVYASQFVDTDVITKYEYDDASNVVRIVEAYDSADEIITKYAYDALNRLSTETLDASREGTDPTSPNPNTRIRTRQRMEYDYDLAGNLTQSQVIVTDPISTSNSASTLTTYQYDRVNRLVRWIDEEIDGAGLANPTYELRYDAVGNVIQEVDATDRATTHEYDRLQRVIRTTLSDPDGSGSGAAPTTSWSYDVLGNVARTTNGNGEVTQSIYDTLGRAISSFDGIGAETRYRYDAESNLISLTDPTQNRTKYAYDALDRLTSETIYTSAVPDPLAHERSYTYDDTGNVQRTKDRNGRGIQYVYDALDQLTQEQWFATADYDNPADKVGDLNWQYDALGRIVTSVSDAPALASSVPRHYEETFVYDNLDRVVLKRNYYDPTGTDTGGTRYNPRFEQAYQYDHINTSTSATPFETIYTQHFEPNATTAPASLAATTYAHDRLGRLRTIVDSDQSGTTHQVTAKTAQFAYDAAGRLTSVQRTTPANSSFHFDSTYSYDGAGRLDVLSHFRNSDVGPFVSYDHSYDAASRINKIQTTIIGGIGAYSTLPTVRNETYAFDPSGQLESRGSSVTGGVQESYNYDANGNRTGSGYTTIANNRVTESGGYSYQYDNEGNVTRRTKTSDGSYSEFTWDLRNRLVQVANKLVNNSLAEQTTYVYGNDDLRIRKVVQSGPESNLLITNVEHYVYDGDQLAAVLKGEWDVNTVLTGGTLQNRYLYAPGIDELLADEAFVGNAATLNWAATDHEGTVRDLLKDVSGSATVTEHREYDAFGNITEVRGQSGSVESTLATLDSMFAFAGREWDNNAKLYYNRHRWFDPKAGRFVSEDPIGYAGGDSNLYRYAGNDPVNYIDPSGLSWLSKALKKVEKEVSRVAKNVEREVSRVGHDVDDFVNEHGGWGTWAIIAASVGWGAWSIYATGALPYSFQFVASSEGLYIGAEANVFQGRGSSENGQFASGERGFTKRESVNGEAGADEFFADRTPPNFGAHYFDFNGFSQRTSGDFGRFGTLSTAYLPPLFSDERWLNSIAGDAQEQARLSEATSGDSSVSVGHAAAEFAWDSVKLWSNVDVESDYNNLRGAGYGRMGATYGAVGNAAAKLAGVSDLADAFEGRDQHGSPLGVGQRVLAGATGTVKLVSGGFGLVKLATASWWSLFGRPAQNSGVNILDRVDDTIEGSFRVARGEARFVAEVRRYGDKLVVSGAHIEGDATLKEVIATARRYGREAGVKEVIIMGAKRSTGANPGHFPKPLRIKVY